MKSKKTPQKKKVTKTNKKQSVTKKTVAKKANKVVAQKSTTKKTASLPISKALKPTKIPVKTTKIPELFKDFYREGERIFLRSPKKFAGFPDLLDLQKRGYEDFIKKYINKLFNNINPVWDIA